MNSYTVSKLLHFKAHDYRQEAKRQRLLKQARASAIHHAGGVQIVNGAVVRDKHLPNKGGAHPLLEVGKR